MYLLIFVLSIVFASFTSSLYNNFTYLSYTTHLQEYYILWIFILATFLLYKVYRLYKQYVPHLKKYTLLIFTSYFSMIIGGLLPYQPNTSDLLSTLHIFLSSAGSLLLLVIIEVLLYHLRFFDFTNAQKIENYYHWFLSSFVMLAIFLGSITIIVEEYFIFIIFFHLYLIEKTGKQKHQ